MRPYGHWPGIIAKRLWTLVAAVIFAMPVDAQPRADYLQYRQASQEAFARGALPPVKIHSTTVAGNLLQTNVTVQPWTKDTFLSFVLAAPAGETTSASLHVEEIYEEVDAGQAPFEKETTAGLTFQRELPVTAKHLAWIRGTGLLKVQVPSIVPGTFGRRLKSGRLTISYSEPIDDSSVAKDAGTTATGPMHNMLAELVANPGDIAQFSLPLTAAPSALDESPVPLGGHTDAVARFVTTREGFVKFTGADLAAAGIDLTDTSLTSVTVWTDGEQVPLHSSDIWEESNRAVEPDDTFILHARDNESTYTATRTHWIRINAPAADHPLTAFMDFSIQPSLEESTTPTNSHFTATAIVEEDNPPVLTKNDQFLTILDYRWVWFTWTPSGNGSSVPNPRDYRSTGSITFDLEGITTGAESASLNFSFYSHLWPEDAKPVAFAATLNNEPIGRITLNNPEDLDHVLQVPATKLRSTSNTLVLTPETSATATLPEIAFDRMTVKYPRSYTMTSTTLEFYPPTANGGPVELRLDPVNTTAVLVADVSEEVPVIIGSKGSSGDLIRPIHTRGPINRRYIAQSIASIPRANLKAVRTTTDLRATTNTADVIVIAWPDFIPDIAPWVDARRAQGHAVTVVDVHDIYDQFGYGHLSPHAIREFIRYAALNWQGSARGPAASTILLVGDSTSAYRNEFRNDVINYVPTMRITDTTDPFASDQWFVNLFGDDHFADALIGRFSVNNRDDLRKLVAKQLDYQARPATGPWKNTLGFIADHSEFKESVDRVMRRAVPPRFFMDSIRMDDLPWIDNYYFPKDIADAREAKVSPVATRRIRDMFNDGASVVTYFGHGSPNIWSNERMWFGGDSPNSDNLLLNNRDRLPIVINMTCNSGAIDYPQPRWNICISEDFMRVENGGAVACFVPSGPGLTVQHERLMMEVGYTLFGPRDETLGHSMQLALWRYLAGGNPPELARMYIFLGDPLLIPHISRPVSTSGEAPVSGPDWPGTVALPADIVNQRTGGAYQFVTYGDTVEPRAVSTFTSTTVALPLPGIDPDKPHTLAVSTTLQNPTSGTRSTVVPVSNLGAIKLVQWRRIDKPAPGTTTATLQLRLRNESPVPLPGLRLSALEANKMEIGASEQFQAEPFEEKSVLLHVGMDEPGLREFGVTLSDGRSAKPLDPDLPFAVAALRPDDQRESVAPAVVDPRSIEIKYRQASGDITASITCQVYIIAAEPLSNLRIGIEGPDGVIIQPSTITVPPVSPGEGTRVTLATTIPTGTQSSSYKIRFDPPGFFPEFARFPAEPLVLGSSQFADPQIVSVAPSDSRPSDGETVFFDIAVANPGNTPVDGLKVQGYRSVDGAAPELKLEPLESKVAGQAPLFRLDPGENRVIRLRWDPFQNSGKNQLRFTVSSVYDVPDANAENNSRELTLDVRTKARIRFIEVGPLSLTPTDKAARQIRFAARLTNEGQTDATGLRIQFHANKPRTPENLLGEADLDSLKAGETKTVTLTYKLKPGEEHKPFRLSCEAHYQGSRQRISVD